MTTDPLFEFRTTHIYMQLPASFEATVDWIGPIASQLVAACNEHDCRRVLIEGALAGRNLTDTDVYDIGDLLAQQIPGLTIALVLHGYELTSNALFFQDVAYNRGVKVQFFTDCDAALHWLLSVN